MERAAFTLFYSIFADDGTISVRNVAVKPDGETFTQICGYADIPDPVNHPAELQVHFPFSPTGDYWILDTDYDNFVSIYSCQDNFGIFKIEFAWILVRDPANVSDDSMKRALDAFTSQNLDVSSFEPWKQDGCTYEDPSGAEPCQS